MMIWEEQAAACCRKWGVDSLVFPSWSEFFQTDAQDKHGPSVEGGPLDDN